MIHACHAGCDISKHWLDLSILSPLGVPVAAARFANDAAGQAALLADLAAARSGYAGSGDVSSGEVSSGEVSSGEVEETLLVIEASGGPEHGLPGACWGAGQRVALIPAQRARHFARSIGQLAKTDRIDAQILALYALRIRPEPARPTGEDHRLLRALVARRRVLVTLWADERKRALQSPTPAVTRSITALEGFLGAGISAIEADIKAAIQSCRDRGNPVLPRPRQSSPAATAAIRSCRDRAALDRRMRTLPGVGVATAATLLAELPELGQISPGQISPGQIAALAGPAPVTRQSGKWRGKAAISGGRKPARDALYMAATTCVFRSKSRFATFYQTLRARGKPHKVALIATMRKMLTTLNAMIQNQQDFKKT